MKNFFFDRRGNFYQCGGCHARYQQRGSDYLDASDPKYDEFFRGRNEKSSLLRAVRKPENDANELMRPPKEHNTELLRATQESSTFTAKEEDK